MAEPARWVTKAEAAEELEISLSTLDWKIRSGEVEVVREGRRVYVRMHGPAYLTDEELLRRAIVREDDIERTVRELEQSASELERERDKAKDVASASRRAYTEMEEAYQKEHTARSGTRRLTIRLGLAVVALLVVVGLLTWQLLT